ncbi:peptidoglycan-binding domain-containing protein [Dactylosporangium sp. NPDC005572]|uniref:peptidoglycan-binding domain-containing protein n=1 Tax=Dactylosporangium sp. NPDC005572 TaxID=3156889 RepID=UPI0033B24E30
MDGKYGGATTRAIRNFQKFFGLTVDGVVGPRPARRGRDRHDPGPRRRPWRSRTAGRSRLSRMRDRAYGQLPHGPDAMRWNCSRGIASGGRAARRPHLVRAQRGQVGQGERDVHRQVVGRAFQAGGQ